MSRRATARAISNNTRIVNRKISADNFEQNFVSNAKLKRSPSIKRVQLEIKVNNSPRLNYVPPIVLHSQSILVRLHQPKKPILPAPNTINNRNMVVGVYHNAKLQEKIEQCQSKLHVDLSYCDIVDRDMLIVTNKLINEKKCTDLWLYGNHIKSEGISTLASSLINNSTLKSLDLSFNQISDAGVYSLTQALLPKHNSSLQILYLSKNGISDDGIRYISDMLRTNQTITELWLSNNEITNKGIQQLARVLAYHNKTLKQLSLSTNLFLTDKCIDYLVGIFEHNDTLKKLWISDCSLTEYGKAKLHQKIHRKNHTRIDL
ncbi:unnamed protein product [Adineta steineri]|uniref:Uncharacterized protein n=1 Tax=Adineta steineri TaxID=433720 RepID=A0A813UW74_9BILA|nr:unnamed protein product [Adineta steineri]CAF0871807.1 unnamed protein product [Adineta steineri]